MLLTEITRMGIWDGIYMITHSLGNESVFNVGVLGTVNMMKLPRQSMIMGLD